MTSRLALAALLVAAPLAAQENAGARLDALRLFRPGEMLRLHVRGVGALSGVFVQLDSATLLVRMTSRTNRISSGSMAYSRLRW